MSSERNLGLEGMAQQPARNDLGPFDVGVRQQDREFVAPDAERAIGPAERTVHELAEAAQEAVATGVPSTVVDGLELVEVDDQERERVLVARCRRHLAIELLLEGPMVAESRQRIEEGIGQRGFIAHLEVGLGRDQRSDRAQEGNGCDRDGTAGGDHDRGGLVHREEGRHRAGAGRRRQAPRARRRRAGAASDRPSWRRRATFWVRGKPRPPPACAPEWM